MYKYLEVQVLTKMYPGGGAPTHKSDGGVLTGASNQGAISDNFLKKKKKKVSLSETQKKEDH